MLDSAAPGGAWACDSVVSPSLTGSEHAAAIYILDNGNE